MNEFSHLHDLYYAPQTRTRQYFERELVFFVSWEAPIIKERKHAVRNRAVIENRSYPAVSGRSLAGGSLPTIVLA